MISNKSQQNAQKTKNNHNFSVRTNTQQQSDAKSQTIKTVRSKSQSQSFLNHNIIENGIKKQSKLLYPSLQTLKAEKIASKQYINIRQKNHSTVTASSGHGGARSRIWSMHLMKQNEGSIKNGPYDKFAKELNIKLPTPRQKFIQFIRIPPFNRLNNHIQFISHMLYKNYEFFRVHPVEIVHNFAKKVVSINSSSIPMNHTVVVDEGQCTYNGKKVKKGDILVRNNFNNQIYEQQERVSLIGLPYHQYYSFVVQYLNANFQTYRKFVETIQIFKIFPQSALQKILSGLTLNFYMKGEILYQPSDPATSLFIIFSGSAARRIIVEIDKTNKIPLQKYSKLIKVTSRSYEHRIKFQKEDLIGVADIVDTIFVRSETILVDENSAILAIDRNVIEENLDEYIVDRLKKYNLRKYPKNYDQLCENYLKQKLESRKTEERKIAALKDEMIKDQNNEKKTQKIYGIIKIYQDRIKMQQKQHLIHRKNIERVIHRDN